jgi:AbiU2
MKNDYQPCEEVAMKADKAIQLLNKRVHWMKRVNEVLSELYSDQGKVIMYEAANITSNVLRYCLIHELVMSISRLLDPPQSGKGKTNLSFEKIEMFISQENISVSELKEIRVGIERVFDPIKKARDKIIAHYDLETWKVDRVTYKGINKDSINEIIQLVIKYVNTANRVVRNTDMRWDPIRPADGTPAAFLEVLKIGNKEKRTSNSLIAKKQRNDGARL